MTAKACLKVAQKGLKMLGEKFKTIRYIGKGYLKVDNKFTVLVEETAEEYNFSLQKPDRLPLTLVFDKREDIL